MIQSPDNQVWVSAISLWEIVVKAQFGKLEAPNDLIPAISAQDMQILSFSAAHASAVAGLPMHHRDPFDRALVAQALCEGLRFLTADKAIEAYKDETEIVLIN